VPQFPANPNTIKEEGLTLFQQGDHKAALDRFMRAAALFQDTEDWGGWSEMHNNMGVVYRQQKNWKQAENALEQALDGFRQINDQNRVGQTLANLGDVFVGQRKRAEAAVTYEQAAALLADSGDGWRQSQVLRALSLHHLRQMHWFLAMSYMEQSLTANPDRGMSGWLFRTLLRFALGLAGLK
jgi:tetratricopeptide (TPR) repeat protein